ncbi:hypothetical protein Tco_0393729 [Tanacetum coccineum]
MVGTGHVKAGVQELHKLLKDDDMWIKSSPEGGGRDVLDEDKYQKAFPRSSKRNRIMRSWTTESSRAVVFIPMNHLDLAYMITSVQTYAWSFLFPNMVATDEIVKVFSSDESPHMSSQVIDHGHGLLLRISLVDAAKPNIFHRLPSGGLSQYITLTINQREQSSSSLALVQDLLLKSIDGPNTTVFPKILTRSTHEQQTPTVPMSTVRNTRGKDHVLQGLEEPTPDAVLRELWNKKLSPDLYRL